MKHLNRLNPRPLEDGSEHERFVAHLCRLGPEVQTATTTSPAKPECLSINESAQVSERPQGCCCSAQTGAADHDVDTIDQQSNPSPPAVGEQISEQESRVELHAHVKPARGDGKLVSSYHCPAFSLRRLPRRGLTADVVEDEAHTASRVVIATFSERAQLVRGDVQRRSKGPGVITQDLSEGVGIVSDQNR